MTVLATLFVGSLLAVSFVGTMLTVLFICSVLAMVFVGTMLAVLFICSVLAMVFVDFLLAVLVVNCHPVHSGGLVPVDAFVVHSLMCLFATVSVLFVDARSHLRAGDPDHAGDCEQYNQREPDSDECLCHCHLPQLLLQPIGGYGYGCEHSQ